jgi:hypothetical protein
VNYLPRMASNQSSRSQPSKQQAPTWLFFQWYNYGNLLGSLFHLNPWQYLTVYSVCFYNFTKGQKNFSRDLLLCLFLHLLSIFEQMTLF